MSRGEYSRFTLPPICTAGQTVKVVSTGACADPDATSTRLAENVCRRAIQAVTARRTAGLANIPGIGVLDLPGLRRMLLFAEVATVITEVAEERQWLSYFPSSADVATALWDHHASHVLGEVGGVPVTPRTLSFLPGERSLSDDAVFVSACAVCSTASVLVMPAMAYGSSDALLPRLYTCLDTGL